MNKEIQDKPIHLTDTDAVLILSEDSSMRLLLPVKRGLTSCLMLAAIAKLMTSYDELAMQFKQIVSAAMERELSGEKKQEESYLN